MNKRLFNNWLWYKLPLVRIAGVKLKFWDEEKAETSVKFRWINQNPFKSMFWAVQGMAAELSTGVLCAEKVRNSGYKISMLVTGMEARFVKKAKGRISFVCKDGKEVDEILKKAIETGEGQTVKMKSTGIDSDGDTVSEFWFHWSFKLKS